MAEEAAVLVLQMVQEEDIVKVVRSDLMPSSLEKEVTKNKKQKAEMNANMLNNKFA